MTAEKTVSPEYRVVAKTASVEETQQSAGVLGCLVGASQTIALDGDLGAGKTHFTQGLAQGLGVSDSVTSPTFNVVAVYESGRIPLYHFDLYRLEKPEELDDIAFVEYLESPGISCIEWASKFPAQLPEDRLDVFIEVLSEGGRCIKARAWGKISQDLLVRWCEQVGQDERSGVQDVQGDPGAQSESDQCAQDALSDGAQVERNEQVAQRISGDSTNASEVKPNGASINSSVLGTESSSASDETSYADNKTKSTDSFVLAFDTANEMISVGLGRIDFAQKRIEYCASQEVGAFRASNEKLVLEIDNLLTRIGVERTQIACLACGRGPGSFTGVRICMATAKGLALGLNVPLFGVSTSDAQAWQLWLDGYRGSLLVLGDAMRKEVYPVRFELSDSGAERLNADTVIKAEALCDWLGVAHEDLAQKSCIEESLVHEGSFQEGTVEALSQSGSLQEESSQQETSQQENPQLEIFQQGLSQTHPSKQNLLITGDGLKKYADLCEGLGTLTSDSLWYPQGKGLLRAMQARWEAENLDLHSKTQGDPCSLLPVYTRLSDAEEHERIRFAKQNEAKVAQTGSKTVQAKAESANSEATNNKETNNKTSKSETASDKTANCEVAKSEPVLAQKDLTTGVQGHAPSFDKVNQESDHGLPLTCSAVSSQTQSTGSNASDQAVSHSFRYVPLESGWVDDVANLEQQVMGSDAWNASQILDELPRADRTWWAAYKVSNAQNREVSHDEDVLVGYAGGWIVDGQVQILKIATSPACQRMGIAKELIGRVALDARDLGAHEMTLEVRVSNTGAHAFYETLGLKNIGKRPKYYSDKEDAFIFTGPLPIFQHDVAGMDLRINEAVSEIIPDEDANSAGTSEKSTLILAIESSCDETALALINGEGVIISDVVASQIDFHSRFGGVVPEIASRKHIEAIAGVAQECLAQASKRLGRPLEWSDLSAVAVTYAPGLVGALVVGMAFAKGLAWSVDVPLIGVNHLEGHLYANKMACNDIKPPMVVSLVSGGHTMLVHVKNWGDYETLGSTLDDAVGEAFDKVAKAMGLGYPGGPIISKLAETGDAKAIRFPRALLHSGDLQFSLSGLKTSVMTYLQKEKSQGREPNQHDVAASFQAAVVDVQVAKARSALEQTGAKEFCLGGGVAANPVLRSAYETMCDELGVRLTMPPLSACTDNASMIALVALDRYRQGKFFDLSCDVKAHVSLDEPY